MATCERCGGNLPRVGGCKLCEMFATGRGPTVVTDDTRFQGYTKVGGAQFKCDATRDYYLGIAREHGVDVGGKQYFSQLAAFPGDPRAWVDSQGEQRRLLEERGWGCDGDLKVAGRPQERAPDTPLADDIADDLVEDYLEARHGPLDGVTIPVKEYHDAREAVVEKHAVPAHLRE